jgi:hypothetical protein
MRKNSNNDTIEIPKLHEVIENVRINMQLRKKITKRGSRSSSTATSTPTTSEKSTSSSSNYSTPIKKEVVDLTNDNDGWIDSAKEFDEPASTTSMKPPKKNPPYCQSPASDSSGSSYNPNKRARGLQFEDEDEDTSMKPPQLSYNPTKRGRGGFLLEDDEDDDEESDEDEDN